MSWRRRWIVLGIAVALAALAAVFVLRSRQAPARFLTTQVDRGDVMEVVGSTGALQAVQTVQVGSQVSGTIQELSADFNSRVVKGQVIARLDPSLFQARLGQAQANLQAARANAERARTTLEDARLKAERAETLSREQLLPESDLETARANHQSAVAGVKAADAAVTQAEASVNQAQVDLEHTIIRAPISGVVIGRSVDVGQTVAASLQAPTLFVIANDLSRMQVLASVDEADVGRVKEGADVTFRVDAFPERTFRGRVEQVRLQPTVVQNVVTYNAIISVDNPGQILMPGMTATVSVISQKREDVLRVPAAVLRFRPEGFGTGAGGRRAPGATGARAEAAEGRTGSMSEGGGREGRPTLLFVPGPDGNPQPRRVRVGLSDGQYVEVVSGLEEGATVVTGPADTGARAGAPRPAGSPSTNPFNPQFQRRQR
jgi:HlyD family secretion protein